MLAGFSPYHTVQGAGFKARDKKNPFEPNPVNLEPEKTPNQKEADRLYKKIEPMTDNDYHRLNCFIEAEIHPLIRKNRENTIEILQNLLQRAMNDNKRVVAINLADLITGLKASLKW